MESAWPASLPAPFSGAHSYAFLGEAGCGKSEIAINLALTLAARGDRAVHFFDLDMTKPLFRSRDQADRLASRGVTVHFEEQFYDAPTAAGGVSRLLRDPDCAVVLDVGGDEAGARAIGGYAPLLNGPGVQVWYVINPYRPWSMDLEHIDGVLSRILGASHLRLDRLRLLGNPNLGPRTTAEEVLAGAQKLEEMVGPYKSFDLYTAREELCSALGERLPGALFPIRLALTYEWDKE